MNKSNLVPSVLLTLAVLIGAGAIETHARQDPNAAGGQLPLTRANLATVDMQQVYQASNAPALDAQKENQLYQEIHGRMQQVEASPFLDKNELPEYLKLLSAAAPTPAQQERAKALVALSQQRQQELNTLGLKKDADLTAADKQRIQALQEMTRDLQDRLAVIQNGMERDAIAEMDVFRREQMRKLWDAVGKVAAGRGIVNVWDRSSLIYSVNDLTPEMIRRVSARPGK